MLVFIDESGDLGFKLERGSSQFFTIALVMFETAEQALRCQGAIEKLRGSLRLAASQEFHFRTDSHQRRLAFLSVVAPHDFHCYTFTLNKASPRITGFKHRAPSYKWVCKTALDNAASDLNDATVVIDGSGERKFRQQMGTYLRQQINQKGSKQIGRVKIGRSHGDALLQLADYVAGVTNRWYEGKPGSETYEGYLRGHRRSLRKWP